MKRLKLLDLIRLLSMIAIVHFHFNERIFYRDWVIWDGAWSFNAFLEPYSRFMAFSGLTIVALSTFLMGLKPWSESRWRRLLLLVGFGAFVLAWAQARPGEWLYFEWDIYAYLVFVLLTLFALRHNSWLQSWLAGLGVLLLSFPVWNWENLVALPEGLHAAVWGWCAEPGEGGWSLLPWLFLAILFYRLGSWLHEKPERMLSLQHWRKWEFALWPLILVASLPQVGAYFLVPIGEGFSCYVHRQDPLEMWSHLIWVIFLGRLNFVTKVQELLEQSRLLAWVSSLDWSTNFGRCYILQFVLIGGLAAFDDFFMSQYIWFEVALILLMPCTELLSRGVGRLIKFKK